MKKARIPSQIPLLPLPEEKEIFKKKLGEEERSIAENRRKFRIKHMKSIINN